MAALVNYTCKSFFKVTPEVKFRLLRRLTCVNKHNFCWLNITSGNFPRCRLPWKGARDGAVVRALASHQCGPGSNPGNDAICGLSLLFVLSFALRGFSLGTQVFPSPQIPTFSNSNSTRNQVDEEPLCVCPTSKYSLFIYIYLYLSAFCANF